MRTVYSTEKISIEGVDVLGIEHLSKGMNEWIMSNRRRLLREVTLPERITAAMFSKCDEKPVRQAFFIIRKRCYFLDFFFPERMVAVEIDGSVHKLKKAHDRQRDTDFRSIGIRTIRISNKDVMSGKLYEKFFKELYK